MHLKEDGLQLPTVFPTMLLREEDRVCWDAVVGHPAVALQHPYHYVRETVLRLGEGHRAHVNLYTLLSGLHHNQTYIHIININDKYYNNEHIMYT